MDTDDRLLTPSEVAALFRVEEQKAAIDALAELLFEHTWGCGHCGGCKCDSDEAASERETDWAKHVARLLTEHGYAKVVEL